MSETASQVRPSPAPGGDEGTPSADEIARMVRAHTTLCMGSDNSVSVCLDSETAVIAAIQRLRSVQDRAAPAAPVDGGAVLAWDEVKQAVETAMNAALNFDPDVEPGSPEWAEESYTLWLAAQPMRDMLKGLHEEVRRLTTALAERREDGELLDMLEARGEEGVEVDFCGNDIDPVDSYAVEIRWTQSDREFPKTIREVLRAARHPRPEGADYA